MKYLELFASFSWSALIFSLLNGYIEQIPGLSSVNSARLMYIGFGAMIGTRLWAIFGVIVGGLIMGHSRSEIANAQLKSVVMGVFGLLDIKPKEAAPESDFYQNINMVAQLFAPVQWLFFYIAAMKSSLIRRAKIFNQTRIGSLYLLYIERFRPEHHCILLGIVFGLHLGMAFSCKFERRKVYFIKANTLLPKYKVYLATTNFSMAPSRVSWSAVQFC